MMRWIVGTSLRFRLLVVALAAVVMSLGGLQLVGMPVDAFPEFAPPRVEIQTPCLGLSASEVEALVTVPLEDVLTGMPDLTSIRSKSVPQLSSIELRFEPGTDLLRARQLVSERVETAVPTLPTWAAPPVMIQPLSSTSRVMKIGLSSETRSLIEMSMISYWTIRAKLLRVPGVANVAIWGERLQMLQVQVDPARLTANGVTLDDVMEVTAAAVDSGLLQFSDGSVIGTGGFVDSASQRYGVRNVQAIKSPADLAQVVVGQRDGTPLRLSDVANVVEDHQPLIGDAVIDDGPGLMLIVEKLPWGNTLEVTRGVEEALKELEPGLTGIKVDPTIFRPATFIETAFRNLGRSLLLGCLLVMLVLALFLFEWRTALISVVAIPLSLVAAGLVLYWRGTTINTMILAGLVIAVGVVVDDAIIDVENIVRRLRQAKREGSTKSTAAIVLDASLEVRGPIIYATLIIVAAAAPVFFLEGLSGSFFKPLALSFTLAVLASLAVALTVTPALALILLARAPLGHRDPGPVRWLQRRYVAMVARVLRRPRRAYAAVAVLAVLGLATLPGFGEALFPKFKERDFLMHFVAEPGTSHPAIMRMVQRAAVELRAIPGVQAFGSHIGQALLADEVVGVNFTELWINISDDVDYDKTVAKVQEVISGYPGFRRDVKTYLRERADEVLSGSDDPVVVRIFGDDLTVLRAKAEEVRQLLAGTEGIVDEHMDLQVDVPQVEVKVDLAAAERYGLKPGDVRRAAGILLAGEEAGDIFRDGKAYDVQVWSTPETRQSLTDILNVLIDTPDGRRVLLAEVASVEVKPTPNLIQHEGGSRRIDIGAHVQGRDLGEVVREVQDKLDGMQFPLGYHAEMLGEFQERQSAQNRILIFGIAAIVIIFLLLQGTLDSGRLALLVLLTLPTALVGGLLAAFVTGRIISLGSLVGFLTVLGIAARNGILMIGRFQHMEKQEGRTFGAALVIRGARDRLSPILMTTLATGLALIPLVVLGQIPGHEIEHPMAVVILGGLVTSTLVNLFVVPALYLRIQRQRATVKSASTAT
jgi:CzcA family heavy metal efflux pump